MAKDVPFRVAGAGKGDRAFLAEALGAGGRGACQELDGAARAWLALEAARTAGGCVCAVAESPPALERLARGVEALQEGAKGAVRTLVLPATASETGRLAGARRAGRAGADLLGERLRALSACGEWKEGEQGLVLTCVQGLLEGAPEKERLAARRLAAGEGADPEELAEWLQGAGYAFGPEVAAKGEASRRGGLLDVWPLTAEWPVRIEFFGNVVESLRSFDPLDQRSRERLEGVELPRVPDLSAKAGEGGMGETTDLLPDDASFVWFSPQGILHHFAMARPEGERDGEEEGDDGGAAAGAAFGKWRGEVRRLFSGGWLDAGADPGGGEGALHALGVRGVEGLADLAGRAVPPDVLEGERRKFLGKLEARAKAGWRVGLALPTAEAWKRFEAVYGEAPFLARRVGCVEGGFAVPGAKWLLAGEGDFYGTAAAPAARRPAGAARRGAAGAGRRVTDWVELRPGERVVHADHGIGKYLGLQEIRFDGGFREALVIEYAEGAKLYVPTTQAHLLSRYVGTGHGAPPLHRLGGTRWRKERQAAERAATDLAAQLLETQARRAALPGHAFAPDGAWQAEFERAFPYTETPDQLEAIAAVKRDMESPKPMDRLICGDAGYGKTEVAMRAAFKAVMDGRQVVLLAPTTVLAQQHYETFVARMSRFPVAIDVVSRFRSPAEQQAALRRTAEGRTDILIGTHRVLQRDVRFERLGLVVIDEEQRFGVAAKEHLKQMRERVDVLTLSATPIPRTLYLGLMGARDMSVIQTAPRERLAIETYVAADSDELVREAVRREIARGGQVFFLHNRVKTIGLVERRLKRLLPGVRIRIGHGQMGEKALAETMRRFIRHECDLLLCTTIIGSGVDIPNVNTLLVDRADRFGMADLHQIRGRVGRGTRQAYAYLLLPRHGGLFGTARERVDAIRRHSSLGAGYKLALRDLELRGAGSVLGAAQSGHIAAVGFDLYCQLLGRTVARLKGEPERPVIETEARFDFLAAGPDPAVEARAAAVPRDYVEDENQRIALYRRLATVAYAREVDELAEELRDRFGAMPGAVRRLLEVARIRIAAAGLGVRTVETKGNVLLLHRGGDEYLMPHGRHVRLHEHGADARLKEILKRLQQLAGKGGGGAEKRV